MKRNFDLAAIKEKLHLFDRGLHERQLIHPIRDWSIGLAFALVIIAAAGWWSAQTYIMNSDVDVAEEPVSFGSVTYRAGLVDRVLTERSENAQAVSALVQNATINIIPEPVGTTTTEITPESVEEPEPEPTPEEPAASSTENIELAN